MSVDGINWFLEILFYRLNQYMSKASYIFSWFSLLGNQPFLSVSAYDALPLTRLEGLKDLRRQLEQHKDQMMDLMRASQGTHFNDLGYFYLFLFERISYNSCSWFNCHRFSSDPNHFSSSYKRLSKLYPFLELLPFYPSFGPVPECPCLFCHLKKC